MVTIVRTDLEGGRKYLRVKDSTRRDRSSLEEKIKNGWKYCSKGEWKRNVRDIGGEGRGTKEN